MRKRNMNERQTELMVNFMKDHKWLEGKNKSKDKVRSAWEDLKDKLNSHGPPRRTICDWRTVWSDYKSNLRKRVRKLKSGKIITPFNKLDLLTIDILSLNDKLSGDYKSLTSDKYDFDEDIEKSTEQRSTDKITVELKEQLTNEESISDCERIDDDQPSHIDDIFNTDIEEEAETLSDNGIKENSSAIEGNDYFDLNLDEKIVTRSKHNNNLKEVCDLLKENRKDILEIEREKISIEKAKAIIEKRKMDLDERKLKLLDREIELKQCKLDIEFKILVENNIEEK